MEGYLLCSLDVGGTSDPAALCVAHVSRRDRLTKARILYLAMKNPVVTPSMHVTWVQEVMIRIAAKIGRGPTRYVVDLSNNSAIGYLLALELPRASLVGVKISGGDQHGAGITAHLVGDVNGKATALPTMTLSRRQLLLDLSPAFTNGLLALPTEDPGQAELLQLLKQQMAAASLKTTASGKQVAIVSKQHDDVLMCVAQLWAATRLPAPREAHAYKPHAESVSSLGWT